MELPVFSECSHPLIKALAYQSDQALLRLFQQHQERGQYFTAIFCRYSHLVYSLVSHLGRSPVQVDYLFAQTWQSIYRQLADLDTPAAAPDQSLQSWILDMTATSINQAELPLVETINYALSAASPPLWCYLEKTLAQLPPATRLMVTLAQTFRWDEAQIAAYLEAEGEAISPMQVREQLQQGYHLLEMLFPQDLREIYLTAVAQ